MKRAITQHEGKNKPGYHIPNPKDKGKLEPAQAVFADSYKVFKDEKELQDHVEGEDNKWDTYSATQLGVEKMTDLKPEHKISFEFYICGWLQYYDQITRNNSIDHTIHFKWEETEVRVYISPRPDDSDRFGQITSPPGSPTSDPKSPTAPPPPYP